MEVRSVGPSGPRLSVVGLGGYPLGAGEDEESVQRAWSVIKASLDSGINWVDTAEGYHDGDNESLLGRVLKADTYVCTKVSPFLEESGLRPQQVRRACEQSLERLGRDHIDVYLAHCPDDDVPVLEAWGALCGLVDDGLVTKVGLSNFSVDDIRACHAERPVDVLQEGLSLIDYLEHRDMVAELGRLGIPTMIYEPLGSGLLTGAIDTETDLGTMWEGQITEWSFYERLFAPGKLERSLAVVDGLRSMGERLGCSVAQLAIAWTIHQVGASWALAGSSKPDHVSDNAKAGDLSLSDHDLHELDQLIPLGPSFSELSPD